MCGLLGIIALRGHRPSVSRETLEDMRDRMAHRGPDAADVLIRENMALAHRRLAVMDPSPTGAQPMTTPDGRYHLVYNGELFNEAELREELLRSDAVPGGFRGDCDTETVLLAFAAWGPASFERLRGMFAIAIYDSVEHVLHLARDPLGIKPLYFHRDAGSRHGAGEFTFASDVRSLLAHPGIDALPNIPMVSAYLTTLRSTLGRHTLFRDVFSLQPGHCARFDATTGELRVTRNYRPVRVERALDDPVEAARLVRATLADSVARHLRSDVPLSALLSGGLDSTILCMEAKASVGDLHTWCSGARNESGVPSDFDFARDAARTIGSQHNEVAVTRADFLRSWPTLIQQTGLPLSTPNEVAIHAVAQDMRAQGFVVTLSGEGADELFGGYELALDAAAMFCESRSDRRSGGEFQLQSSAWVSLPLKPQLLSNELWSAALDDELLLEHYDELFAECAEEVGAAGTPLDAHLRFLRKSNLTQLLERLDRATMTASIEGRTPFADVAVAELADRLPMSVKYAGRGKAVLRDAWRSELPAGIAKRSKESFALPFQDWLAESASHTLESSPFAKICFADSMRRSVAANASEQWYLAWPMMNLALWGDAWWA